MGERDRALIDQAVEIKRGKSAIIAGFTSSAVPEPFTILGSAAAIGMGGAMER